MTQTGAVRTLTHRSFEDYESMHEGLKHIFGGDKSIEHAFNHGKTSTAALVEIQNVGTTPETIADIAKTEETMILVSDTDDNGYDAATVTIVYKDNDGVSHTSTAPFNAANSTTEAAFVPAVTDYYCMVSATCSIAVLAGDNIYVGITGCRLTAANRRATIIATATTALAATFVGVGQLYGAEAANQADTGYIATCVYLTPWGEEKTATWTFPADSSVATNFLNSGGAPVQDFYRRRSFTLADSAAAPVGAIDECRLCNSGKTAIYGVIDIANIESVHSRLMALGTAYGKTYLGDIRASFPSTDIFTVQITWTPKGRTYPHIDTFDIIYSDVIKIAEELEPLSEVTFKFKKTADANHVVSNFNIRWMDVVV
jgi:hypothetical protein